MKIFNWKQADLFIHLGAKVVSVGLGDRNKMYIEFMNDERFRELMDRWSNREIGY